MSAALPIRIVEKPWGRDALPAPFEAQSRLLEGKRIGEIWFEPPPELDGLLVKYLFTSEKLSVQVHPSDAQAPAGSRGKDECWLILDAEPGAQLAIGFNEPVDAKTMHQAALDGSIEQLLTWHSVEAGDFFYLPAGTVHAIGAGITLLEIQQNCDITYRLYDYGRPRELHLDEAVAVAEGRSYDPKFACQLTGSDAQVLVEGPHFRLHRMGRTPTGKLAQLYSGAPLLVVPTKGGVSLSGKTLVGGECGMALDISEVHITEGSWALVAQAVEGKV